MGDSISLRRRLQQQPSSVLVSELLSPLPLQDHTAHLYVRLTHSKRSQPRSCIFAGVIINKLSGSYYCIISCIRNLQALFLVSQFCYWSDSTNDTEPEGINFVTKKKAQSVMLITRNTHLTLLQMHYMSVVYSCIFYMNSLRSYVGKSHVICCDTWHEI